MNYFIPFNRMHVLGAMLDTGFLSSPLWKHLPTLVHLTMNWLVFVVVSGG